MALSILAVLLALPITVLSQYNQTLTNDKSTSIYVPIAGSTSAVATPAATPTIIYNCQQMPLICENVAAWANSNGGNNGDLAKPPLFYYDPDPDHKNGRRGAACGCFQHDNCLDADSKGKRNAEKITDIATSTLRAIPTILPQPSQIILAGPNPGQDNNGNPKPRNPLASIPGRFFGQGTAFSCDEFPAAVFIQGGSGAKTICAMHSWQIYLASNSPGKWPLPAGSGTRWEQDWQARLHDYLRVSYSAQFVLLFLMVLPKFFGIGPTKGKNAHQGWGTVYPFYLSTTTLAANAVGKGFLVVGPNTSKTVLKRNALPATHYLPNRATATHVVSGNDELDRAEADYIGLKYSRQNPDTPKAIPNPTITPPPVLAARQGTAVAATTAASCTASFDQQGDEDIDALDPGFDDPTDNDLSKPQCADAIVSASDVQNCANELDSLGDNGYEYDNCCGGGAGGACGLAASNGTAFVLLCGEECIGCAQLANYVQGIHDGCQSNDLVGGSQVINEANSLTVSIDINDTT